MARKLPDPVVSATWLAGQILIAMPAMGDPRFAQAVIYLCDHSAKGAMGIVVNRPLENPSHPQQVHRPAEMRLG